MKDIISRSREIVGEAGKYNAVDHVWKRLPGDRTLEFAGVRTIDELGKWRGRPHDIKLFDELTEFQEELYLALIGWARTEVPGLRTRVISATNPALGWVYRRWRAWLDPNQPNRAKPGEIRWYIRVDGEDREVQGPGRVLIGNQLYIPRSRTFIPARLVDNKFLSASDDYLANLSNLPEPLRSQLMYGDWLAGQKDHVFQIIPRAWVLAAQQRWRQRDEEFKARRLQPPLTHVGLDVGYMRDKSVIAPRRGSHVDELVRIEKQNPLQVAVAAGKVLDGANRRAPIRVDVIGIGAGTFAGLGGYNAEAFDGRASAVDEGGMPRTDRTGQMRFHNMRAFAWWHMRDLLDPYLGDQISLPPDDALTEQLCAPRWRRQTSGAYCVEDKEEIVKRLGYSPDDADAVVMAFIPDVPIVAKPVPGRQMPRMIG